jgi:hypothetical protein
MTDAKRSRPTVALFGILGQTPYAGVTWQALHYLEGLRRLGCDVYYFEDTGAWPFDRDKNTVTDDPAFTLDYIARSLRRCGLEDRWAYAAASRAGRRLGPLGDRFDETLRRCDALVNLTGSTPLRDEHRAVPVRIYLETDPVLPQIEIDRGQSGTIDFLNAHTHLFSYGENFGNPDCGVPLGGFTFHPTRQPVILDWWRAESPPTAAPAIRLTTIANWKQTAKDFDWRGQTYTWSKHVEFERFIDLPRRTPCQLELALSCGDPEAVARLRSRGWSVIDALDVSRDLDAYRDYLRGSSGEFTVAKDQNVRLRSGWFSDRSACYLAAGRPVVTQDTGFGNILPTARGLFPFNTIEEIVAALDSIASDYESNARRAREIAAEFFDAPKVLASILERCGLA